MFDDLIAQIEAHPKNLGPMRDASAHGKITGPCGDTVEMWLRIDSGRIRKASFISDGCGYSVHCSSIAAKLTEGMRPEEAEQLTQTQVLEEAGPVPEDHRHCALLAANTIREAIENFRGNPVKTPLLQRLKSWLRL